MTQKKIKIQGEIIINIESSVDVVIISCGQNVYNLFRMRKGVHILMNAEIGKVGQYYGTRERCLVSAIDDIIKKLTTEMKINGIILKDQE